ncbi:MAG TPA: exodeoxyribonuclease V subunit gamma, partial [Rudaea sp.]|nr:exodeoxyribonuclease V subunit gamma [Rudaea sp.]
MQVDSSGMIIYRASRLEALLEPLQTLMQAVPPSHALAPHSVIAAHPGMQRWLSRELALRRGPRGIVANLRIELPSEWLDRLALAVLGEEAVALRPYRRDVLRWRIHECLDTLDDERVEAYLRASTNGRAQRRFQLAERLARIYTRYLVYRPDWLRDWAAGRDATRSGTFLAPLWKMLHRQIALPHRGEMIARLLAQLANPAADVLGAEPLHVFGIAHLAPAELDVLRAVARHRPIVLYVPDPCREFWGGLRTDRRRLRELLRQDPDAPATQAAFLEQDHPLLASWGRMGQQFLLALDDSSAAIDERHWQDQSDTPRLDTRLHRVQESIRQLKPGLIGADVDFETARADCSLRVHACHTRLRELEVLRDALLRARADDPRLKPSGIVVMMPDIQAYLPLLPTVFGEAGRHEGPLPYHCFDVAVARAHPLFNAFRQLLDLAQARVTAPEVVDLLAVPQVARKLGLGAGDVDVLTRWLQDSRVAWALDAEFRTRFDVPAIAEHTFAWAMDRLIAGYAVGSPDGDETTALVLPDAHIAPLGGVHGPQAALVGALDALLVEVDAWSRAGAEAELARDLRHGEQVDDFRRGDTRLRQIEQLAECAEQRMRARNGNVEAVVGQRTFVAPGFAEHGRQQRQVGLDIRHDHDDAGRFQCGIVGTRAQQHVAQHLELAQSRMAGVHAQRAIRARGFEVGLGANQPGVELADAFLQARQARVESPRIGLVLPVALVDRRAAVIEREQELLAHAAPAGEQWMVLLEESNLRRGGIGILAQQFAQALAVGLQAAPEFAARIGHVK